MTTITHQTAETQFIEVNGATFAYRRWGNQNTQQPPLFFLPKSSHKKSPVTCQLQGDNVS